MSGWRDRLALAEARYLKKPTMWLLRDPRLLRPVFAAALWARRPRLAISIRKTVLGELPALMLTPKEPRPGAILYLHGGGFVIGGPVSYLGLAGQIALAARQRVYLPDYRLAPEQPFPAASEDAAAAWSALAAIEPGMLGLAGDSAGGNLALGLLHSADRKPDRVALLSPITDMRPETRDRLRSRPPDQILPRAWAEHSLALYLGDALGDDPRASPLARAFDAPPPTLIQYAEGEALSEQVKATADAMRAAGGHVTLEGYPGTYHAFQLGSGESAGRAIARIGAFLSGATQA